jgi:hypothetical protein
LIHARVRVLVLYWVWAYQGLLYIDKYVDVEAWTDRYREEASLLPN